MRSVRPHCPGGSAAAREAAGLDADSSDARALFVHSVLPLRDELLRKARRLSGNDHDAEDLVQETMCLALTGAATLVDPSRARAWAHSILHNAFVSLCRRNSTRAATPFDPSDLDEMADRSACRQPDLVFDLERAMAGLDETFRDAVIACDVEGQSYVDAASELGCPPGTLMSRLHRGRQRLRAVLD